MIFINIMVFLIAILHFWFFLLESLFWQKEIGLKTFKIDRDFARKSAVLAANQGIYNLFLAAGLIFSLFANNTEAFHLKLFILTCVTIAGIFGGLTANFKIFLIQALPAGLTLIFLCLMK